ERTRVGAARGGADGDPLRAGPPVARLADVFPDEPMSGAQVVAHCNSRRRIVELAAGHVQVEDSPIAARMEAAAPGTVGARPLSALSASPGSIVIPCTPERLECGMSGTSEQRASRPRSQSVAWPDTRTWGSTPAERRMQFPCDRHLPACDDALFRAVSVAAPAPLLFRWLCQLRVAPYSYDWLDNFGRRSPRQLT